MAILDSRDRPQDELQQAQEQVIGTTGNNRPTRGKNRRQHCNSKTLR
ncbi:MAG: hypothetical protein KME05_09440 [Gloeocapsa sp. UFS-A4-WI-NPMV-4B04]|nr:hypothetical protein [Gloeocapsa sp. UFS-A4-WI-NPMV-4B04]